METQFEELVRYVGWTEDDLASLRAFHLVGAPHFPEVAGSFYEKVREHAGAHAVLTGEEQLQRLQRSLVAWMHRVCLGARDAAYFDETAQIGRVHVRVGLPQRYVVAAMSLVRRAFGRLAEHTDDPAATRASIERAFDLELAVMVESYHDDFLARARRLEAQTEPGLNGASCAAALDRAPLLVIGMDAAGLVVLFNRAAEEATGHAPDEAIGRRFVELVEAEELHDRARIADAASGKRDRDAFDVPMATKAGKRRVVHWRLARVAVEGGSLEVIAIGQDVTDARQREERVRQSERLASLGTLAAGLAHEIRNPLNGADLHLTVLERTLLRAGADVESLEAVRIVRSEIDRLSALVSEFLDFARPKPLDRRPASLRAVCEHAVGLVAADASTSKVHLAVDLPANDVVMRVDRAKVQQVLLNLLQNAIEAMAPIGGGRALLRARRSPFHVTLELEDEGPGIPSPSAPIFDAFYSTKPTGTGLGLAIAHRIVTDHGGSIAFESAPGRTVFRLTLPLEETP